MDDAVEHWNDGHDMADWGATEYQQACSEHIVTTLYRGPGGWGNALLPAGMIKILVTQSSGTVCGKVTATVNNNVKPVPLAVVDIFDNGGNLWQTVVSDDTGYYQADDIPNGDYTIALNPPIGLQPDQEVKEFSINRDTARVNFSLTPVTTAGKVKNIWWWKTQLSYLRDGKPAEITMAKMNNYGNIIFNHFYGHRGGAAIQIENVTYAYSGVARPLGFSDFLQIFLGPYNGSNESCARHALLANLLNIASIRQLQTDIVTLDGATAGQAITYLAELIQTGDNNNCYVAFINLRRMHMAEKIPAGIVPLNTSDILYKDGEAGPLPNAISLRQNHPNPFNLSTQISFSLPEALEVTLEIFNVAGQRVALLVNDKLEAGDHTVQWDGKGADGVSAASGIYFYRLKAGEFADTRKMILLK